MLILLSNRKVLLAMLFGMGSLLVAITIVRIVMTVSESHSQAVRSIWGTAEMVCATFVANAPALYAVGRKAKGRDSVESTGDSNNLSALVSPVASPPV